MTKMKRIVLIHSHNDELHGNMLDSGYLLSHPNMGLISLKNYLEKYNPKCKVEAYDELFYSRGDIIDALYEPADLIGFSDLFYNTINNQEYAKLARMLNPKAKIIFGNVNAAGLGKKLVRKPFFNLFGKSIADYVYFGYAEEALLRLSLGEKPKSKIFGFGTGVDYPTNMNKLPFINLKGFEKFIKHYDSRKPDYDQTTISPFAINGNRGCIKSVKRGACSYCTEINQFINIQDRNKYWDGIRHLFEDHGIKYFFESADSFLFGNLPLRTKNAMPKDLKGKLNFRVYGNYEHITEKSIRNAKEFGMNTFFTGIENVSESILIKANKRYDINYHTFDDFFKKLDILEDNKITFYLPILLGLEGENKKSLEKNLEFVEEVSKRYKYFEKFYGGIVVPVSSSDLFKKLKKNKKLCKDYRKAKKKIGGKRNEIKLNKTTKIDYTLLMILMGKYIWNNVTFNEVYDSMNEMIDIVKKNGKYAADNFGVFPFEKKEYKQFWW